MNDGGKAVGAIIFASILIGLGGFLAFAHVEQVSHKIRPAVEPGSDEKISGDQKNGGVAMWPGNVTPKGREDIPACPPLLMCR